MAPSSIPLIDPKPEIEAHREEILAAISRVVDSGHYALGADVRSFEAEAAEYLGVEHCVGVNSGTDAIVIGLRAAGVSPGDEVVTTAFSFFATAEAITAVGATPRFVDIDPDSYNISPALIEEAVTEKTTAIVPAHLFGQTCDMDPIMEIARRHDLKVLEDAAQSFGAEHTGGKAGSIGDVGAFSFYPTKNLAALGDGGLIATNDGAIADDARMLRAHGARRKYFHEVAGYNSLLDTIHAAVLRVKLPYLDARVDARRAAADAYRSLLSDVDGITLPSEAEHGRHSYNQYTIRVADGLRDDVMASLAESGVTAVAYYPVPLHNLPVYEGVICDCPRAEEAAREVLSLPFWPEMERDVQGRVAARLEAAVRQVARG